VSRTSESALEERFNVCPACSAPWHLHWVRVWEDGALWRKYNTCGHTRKQLEIRRIYEETRVP
jgi:hypothetical protein